MLQKWKHEKVRGGDPVGPESLAGVLMDVTMTTKDLLGEGGSESIRVELWKLVIRCRERIKAHALREVVS